MPISWRTTRPSELSTKVSPALQNEIPGCSADMHVAAEATRYSNPLKQKFKLKRMAAEGMLPPLLKESRSLAKLPSSGRWCCRACAEAAQRANAGRISTTEQDSVPAKPPGKRQQRTAFGALHPVRSCVPIVFHILQTKLLTFATNHLSRYPNLHEVRLIPTKKDIAFVEYMDEGSASVAKDALHNYKLDGENKIKVRLLVSNLIHVWTQRLIAHSAFIRSLSPENKFLCSCSCAGGVLTRYIVLVCIREHNIVCHALMLSTSDNDPACQARNLKLEA